METKNQEKTSRKRVIIVGAGISGLAAARELIERRYDVLVVEGRYRPGGRLRTVDMDVSKTERQAVDSGGAFIHGIYNNPIYTLCERFNISTSPSKNCLLTDSKGWAVDPTIDVKIESKFNEILTQATSACKEKDSFGDIFSKFLKVDIKEKDIFDWHVTNLEMSCGTSLKNLGKSWNEDEAYAYGGKHVTLKKGFKELIERLAEGVTILYGMKVVEIALKGSEDNSRNDLRTSHPSSPTRCKRKRSPSKILNISDTTQMSYDALPDTNSTSMVSVTCLTKSKRLTFLADAVICTLPLGILKLPPNCGGVSFSPDLPSNKLDAIYMLGNGNLNKCILTFEYHFWSDVDFIGHVSPRNFLFWNGFNSTNKNVIVCLFGGNYAEEVEELDDEFIVRDVCSDLAKICGRKELPTPLDYLVTRWRSDIYARGSFSYIPPGVSPDIYHDIAEPICHNNIPKILFAGEATTMFHPSTIHGAYNTGIREAYRLDLALEKDLNNDQEFEEDVIYKETFLIGTNNEAVEDLVADGGDAVKRHNKSKDWNRKNPRKSAKKRFCVRRITTIHVDKKESTRKSKRAQVVSHTPVGSKYFMKTLPKNALYRALDSFGYNAQALILIRDRVYSRKTNLKEIKAQCEKLVSMRGDYVRGWNNIVRRWEILQEDINT